jgi:uncharacterized membrane protein
MTNIGKIFFFEKTIWGTALLCYILFLLWQANILNIWVDEAYTLATTANSLPVVIKRSYNFEGQPPLYFMLLSIWRWFNNGIFFARLFSVISVLLSAVVFYKLLTAITQQYYSNRKWLVALYLCNPFTIWAALEIRLYAFLLLLAVWAIYFFVLYVQQKNNKHLWGFLLISLAGLYTQYYFVFLMAGLVLAAAIIKKDTAFFIKMALYAIPVMLLFLPNLYFMSGQLGLVQTFKTQFTFSDRIITVWSSVKNVLLGFHLLSINRGWRMLLLAVFAALFALAFFKNYKAKKQQAAVGESNVFLFALALAVMLVIISLFTAVMEIDHIDRYLTIAFPLCTLLFVSFNKINVIKPVYCFAAVLLYFTVVNTAAYIKPLAVKKYDYKAMADYLTHISKPGEPLLFYRGGIALSFQYYYNGSNPVVPLPHPTKFNSTETDYAATIKDTAAFSTLLANIKAPQKTYLVVTNLNEPIYTGHPEKKLVDDYMKLNCHVTLDTLFYGNSKESALRIRRIEKK